MPTVHLLTFISAGICTLIDVFLILLILHQKPKEKSSWFLIGWITYFGLVIQVVGSLIIASSDPLFTLWLYQRASIIAGLVCLFYFFVVEYLELKVSIWLNWLALAYIFGVAAVHLAIPDFIIKGVLWDPHVQFFIPDFNFKTMPFVYTGVFFWLYGIFKIARRFQKTKSAITRNRLKYLMLGGVLPLLGITLISLPITTVRRYPLDMWSITLGAICLVYGILRYQLLDLTVIIRKGLIYSVLTTTVTGIYLLFAFLVQRLLGITATPVSIPAAFSTAMVVAFVFQPLQNFTQSFIDKTFFRKPYDPQLLLSQFSEVMTTTIELNKLGTAIINLICDTLQIGKALLLVTPENSGRLNVLRVKGYPKTEPSFSSLSSSTVTSLEQYSHVVSIYEAERGELVTFLRKLGLELLVPLKAQDKLLGVLGLGPRLSEQPYTLEEFTLLETLGNQAAIALESAFLFEQIRKEKQKVEELLAHEREVDELKSEFITIASHHLRSPLTVIQGYLDNLMQVKEKFSLEEQKFLDYIAISAKTLSSLIEEILLVSSIEKGKVTLNKEPVDLVILIQDTVEEFLVHARKKQLLLKFIKPDTTIPAITGDKLKIRLVLSSLVDNAIKFTKQGSVEISLVIGKKEMITHVTDTGTGIPQKEIPRLFTKFHQVRKELAAMAGMGLGLYIAKLIIEAHGGRIWVKSRKGEGTTVSFSLPRI